MVLTPRPPPDTRCRDRKPGALPGPGSADHGQRPCLDHLPRTRGSGRTLGPPRAISSPAFMFHPGYQHPGRGGPHRHRGARALQRTIPSRTRVSLSKRPHVHGLDTVLEEGRAGHGSIDGDDRVPIGLRGAEVPYLQHSPRT